MSILDFTESLKMFNESKLENDLMDKYRSLIEDFHQKNNIEDVFIKLSETQKEALQLFKEGENILVLGAGGTGKSKLIQEMCYQVRETGKNVVVCATTGIAAYNISGITLNSFMGIGTGEQDIDTLVNRVMRKFWVKERIKYTDIMIIDEISMASAELFEKVNAICQSVRRNMRPFGGIQVVLTGDFYQLLPVFNKNPVLFPNQDTRLIFESSTFKKYFNKKNTIILTQNFRQNDTLFLEVLMRLRRGEQTDSDIEILRKRLTYKLGVDPTDIESAVYLVASNKRAQEINIQNLNSIKEPIVRYSASFNKVGDEKLSEELCKELQGQFMQKGITEVTLKKGARVMLIKNLSVAEGLVNGSVGTVVDFDKLKNPKVKFDNGVEKVIEKVEWELDIGESKATASQLPLMLCWAITFHKSQSTTLNKAILDLGGAFCDHMVYVGLSRLRSLDGLYLTSFDPAKITVNKKVQEYFKK